MIKAQFGKSKKKHIFRNIAEAESYADNIGAKRIKFDHDPVPLIKIREEWVWLCF